MLHHAELSVDDADELSGWLADSMKTHGLVQISFEPGTLTFQCNPLETIIFATKEIEE